MLHFRSSTIPGPNDHQAAVLYPAFTSSKSELGGRPGVCDRYRPITEPYLHALFIYRPIYHIHPECRYEPVTADHHDRPRTLHHLSLGPRRYVGPSSRIGRGDGVSRDYTPFTVPYGKYQFGRGTSYIAGCDVSRDRTVVGSGGG